MNKSKDKLSNDKELNKKNDEDKMIKIEDKKNYRTRQELLLIMHNKRHYEISNEQ